MKNGFKELSHDEIYKICKNIRNTDIITQSDIYAFFNSFRRVNSIITHEYEPGFVKIDIKSIIPLSNKILEILKKRKPKDVKFQIIVRPTLSIRRNYIYNI